MLKETSRSAVFTKLKDGSQQQEWTQQRFVVRRSRGTAMGPKIGYALRLIRQGKIGLLVRNVLARIFH